MANKHHAATKAAEDQAQALQDAADSINTDPEMFGVSAEVVDVEPVVWTDKDKASIKKAREQLKGLR